MKQNKQSETMTEQCEAATRKYIEDMCDDCVCCMDCWPDLFGNNAQQRFNPRNNKAIPTTRKAILPTRRKIEKRPR